MSEKLTWKDRLKEAALNKVAEGVILAVVGIGAVYFGAPHALEKLGFDNPVADVVNLGSDSAESASPQQDEVVVEQKKESNGTLIEPDNVGFKLVSQYLGMKTKFEILDPGEHEPPFTELRSGEHELMWSVHVATKEGGMLGIGATVTDWQVEGVSKVNFVQNSLYALLKSGESEFLREILQPIVSDSASSAMTSIDVKKLATEIEDTVQEDQVAEKSETQSEVEKLTEALQTRLAEDLNAQYSIELRDLKLANVRRLHNADLSSPNLEKLTCKSIFREAKPLPPAMTLRNSTAGGVLGVVFTLMFAGVLIFFVANLHGSFL